MTEPARAVPASERSRVARAWWLGVGFLAVGVGSVGVVVPGLPTTVFFVVAAWCFGRSSPRFEQWVLNLPKVGPLVRDHRAGLGMPRRAKVMAVGVMWIAIAVSSILLRERLVVVGVIVALGLAGTAYLLGKVPTYERCQTPFVRSAGDEASRSCSRARSSSGE
jgi:uncharacterized membrane protein YbaN (DUF454 family)